CQPIAAFAGRGASTRVRSHAHMPIAGPSRIDLDPTAEPDLLDALAKHAFGGGRAADVAHADEQDSHLSRPADDGPAPGLPRYPPPQAVAVPGLQREYADRARAGATAPDTRCPRASKDPRKRNQRGNRRDRRRYQYAGGTARQQAV